MFNEAIPLNTQAFFADKAYELRSFAMPKRHTIQEIKAQEVDAAHTDRGEVEAFIAEIFYRSYQANIKYFMPKLIALRDEEHKLIAAFGMREASNNPLFLEQYLDAPIEKVMSKSFDRVIHRSAITEIGNLAVANPRNSGILIAHVVQHGLAANLQWGVATAHHTLQNGLIKSGVDVTPIHAVDPNRLPADELAHWGSYYEHNPQIIAVSRMANK